MQTRKPIVRTSKFGVQIVATKDTIELMNKSPQNFERLVLICMDSYDSEKGRILQHFSRSTRFAFLCTAQISNFQQKKTSWYFFAFFRKISQKFSKFCHFSAKFWWILPRISRNVQQFSEKTKKMLICRKFKFSNFCEICWYFRNWWKSSFVHFIVSIVSLRKSLLAGTDEVDVAAALTADHRRGLHREQRLHDVLGALRLRVLPKLAVALASPTLLS